MTCISNFQNHQNMIDVLKRTEAIITFTKTDGSEREMRGTLREDLTIPYVRKTERATSKKNDDVQAVFDLEKQEWRSFRWDSLVNFEFDW